MSTQLNNEAAPEECPGFTTWSYSLGLLVAYIAAFELWLLLPRAGIVASGVMATVFLALVEHLFALRGYFWNRWDRLVHASVILDIALESSVIPLHEQRGFYLCAAGFAAVIIAYRLALRRCGACRPANT